MDFEKPDFVPLADIIKYFVSMLVVMGGYILNKKLNDLETVIEDVKKQDIRIVKIEKDIEYCKKENEK